MIVKVEEYIGNNTRYCSNEIIGIFGQRSYHEWLTPEDARAVAEISRKEAIFEVLNASMDWFWDSSNDFIICDKEHPDSREWYKISAEGIEKYKEKILQLLNTPQREPEK